MKWKRRKWSKFLFIVILIGCLTVYLKQEQILAELNSYIRSISPVKILPSPQWTSLQSTLHTNVSFYDSSKAVTIKGCTLPKLNPWDPSILSHVSPVPEVSCSTSQVSLLYTRLNNLFLNKTVLNQLGYDRSSVRCGYRYMQLVDSDTYKFLDESLLSGYSVELSGQYTSIWARCILSRWSWLDSTLALPEYILQWMGVEVYHNILLYVPRLNKTLDKEKDKYSVVTLIIDGLSQLNLIRSLPLTKSYLDSLGGLLFKGQHKVGHNSYPNVMALLSGETGGNWPAEWPNRTGIYYLDDHRQPLLPRVYQKHGYVTMMLEDLQLYGAFNREGKIGFRNPPAMVYYRAAFWAMIKEEWGYLRNRLVGKFGAYACLQEQLLHVPQFQTIKDFIETYSEEPSFSHIHLTEYLHNDLNMAKLYDRDLLDMLRYLVTTGAVNNTFFMILGDHGFQRAEDPFILTDQGRVENNMPAFYLLPPANLKEKKRDIYDNLVRNSQKLTSFYDINQMLRDILAAGVGKSSEELFSDFEGHGTSLFTELADRTCQEAEIPEDYCSCTDGVVKLSPSSVRPLAVAILKDTDQFVSSLERCQMLQLNQVKEAMAKVTDQQVFFSIQIEVKPHNALFEASFSFSLEQRNLDSSKLTRLDWYSDTSQCVPDQLQYLKPYCIC
eukprot:GFUD01034024.1.p1 GENE.GFUD01034024.1~~GFUD01034024.1.p1  ORF type:complete len:665 (-),score=137.74 GFUD01034024.1:75-2069(-)